jgi:flagellar basal-body rod modification protein FlgD
MEKIMAVTEVGASNQIQMDYMKLLVTQMQNQNPLDPMDNDQMTSQLTQISQLEQMESQASSFAKVLETTEHSYATSLLGKEVSFYYTLESGELGTATGIVDLVTRGTDGEVQLSAGERTFVMDDVASIRES